MSALIRWTLPLVAYLCVGTVISAAIGYGYLRRSGRLDDDTMFRVMALLQGVDLEALKQEGKKTEGEVPAEEQSFAEQQLQVQGAALRFDAKQKQLADSLVDFDYQLRQVSEATQRYAQLRTVVEQFLEDQQEKFANLGLAKVREQLEALIPKKQAKPILISMIEDGRVEEVILLLGSMKPQIRKEILRTFDTPTDVEILYRIQTHMLTDDPARPIIDAQLDALKQLQSQDR
jgi:hypothetical protein